MEPLLEIKNLTKTFRGREKKEFAAVDHVNFCVYPRETLGIVGESGSGKSTIARLITGLTDAAEGEIRLKGEPVSGMQGKKFRKICSRIQMVFQSPAGSFDPRRTLGDGIGESLRNSGIKKQERNARVKELLRRCGLPEEYAGRYPHEVSGGECQRAAIARALAIMPELLICDEATSSLDVTVQKQVIELLEGLKKEKGIACLFICHDLALVQQFCDRVLVMHAGRIVEEGRPDDVIFRPQSEYTKRLVEAVL